MARLSPYGKFRAFSNAGLPLSGGKLYTYEANTTTPKPTYTDASEDTANANPVVLDSNGYADVWLEGGAYKFILKDSTDVTLWTVDDITSDEARSFGYTTATLSTNTSITSVYDSYFLICTAALTLSLLPAATAGDGFFFIVKNTGSGVVTIDPSDAETINGTSTATIAAGSSAVVQCNGASWQTIFNASPVPYTAASASGAASLEFAEDTDNGTNKVTLAAPAALGADRSITFPDAAGEITLNTATQTLANKTLPNPTLVDTSDNTKGINFDFTGASAGAIGTLVGWFTNDRTITIQDSTGTLALTSQLGGTPATPQNSTSGTSIDFTGIPAGTKQIFMTWDGVSTNGTDQILIQLGDSGGIEATGYAGVNYDTSSSTTFSIGFPDNTSGAAFLRYAHWEFTLLDSSTNTWVCKGHIGFNNSGSYGTRFTVGSKSLSATLDRIRVTTSGGANTFDAGKINILYS